VSITSEVIAGLDDGGQAAAMTATTAEPIGALVRTWRERRRRSQLDVALAADVSARHLSFIETGRSTPSRAMIERLCDELDVPLRHRNAWYLAAGFAPAHPERALSDLGAAHDAIQAVLTGHAPNPALAVNVQWELLAANDAAGRFLGQIPAELLAPPVNILRATLHPDGLSRQIRNLAQWRTLVLRRVRRQLERTASDGLADLLAELESYPAGHGTADDHGDPANEGIVIPMRLSTEAGDLSLLYTTTLFGSPRDVTLDEIAVETFFPADAATARTLRVMAGG
jgi:transcriptional regulator with XRE-family HTH domain